MAFYEIEMLDYESVYVSNKKMAELVRSLRFQDYIDKIVQFQPCML